MDDRTLVERSRTAALDALVADAPPHQLKAPLYRDVDLEQLPAVSWQLEQHLPAGGLTVLYGPPGSGKSFLALAWALAIASCQPWLRWRTLFGPVIYVAAEGGRGITGRVRAYRDAHELVEPTAALFRLAAVNLTEPLEVADFISDVAYSASDPALVVFDTMARCMAGADENSAQDVGRVIAAADRIRNATEATVLLVHHTGKDGLSERGSSALRGAADAMFSLKDGDGVLTLECTKQKDSIAIEPQRLHLVVTGSSCVIEPLEGSVEPRGLTPSQRTVLETLKDCQGDDGSAPTTIIRASRLEERKGYRALSAVVKAGYVVKVQRRYVLTTIGEAVLLTTDRPLT